MSLLATVGPNVSLTAEPVTHLGGFTVSNSTMLGLLGLVLTFGVLIDAARRAKSGRHNRLSVAILWGYETLLDTVEDVIGDRERARKLAPLAITMFFLITINNWLEILPIVGPVTWHGLPLFRGLAADLNFTLALAIITLVTAQVWAIQSYGLRGNIGRYLVNPFKDPMHAFEGFLELVAEFSRTLALALRLFGNIFGGEVLLVVIAFITSWAVPLTLPVFMLFELFIGIIQAYIFFMLTAVYVSLGAHGPRAPGSQSKQQVALDNN